MMDGYKAFAEYFKQLYEAKEGKAPQTKVAEKLGITQSTLSKMVRGAMIPSDDLAPLIIQGWSLDEKEFMDNIYKFRQEAGAKFFREAKKREEAETKDVVMLPKKPRLPITAAAGVLSDYLGGVLAHECEQVPVVRSIPDYDFTMLVKGNSMEPKFEGGDEIACKKVESLIEWGKAYVLATRDGAVLKRIYEAEDGVRCVSYNHDEYPDFFVKGDDILGVYRVVGLIRV